MEVEVNLSRNAEFSADTAGCDSLGGAITATHELLTANGWDLLSCGDCEMEYYAKESTTAQNCGAYDCAEGYGFLTMPRRNINSTFENLSDNFTDFFTQQGFKKAGPIHLVNNIGSTLFVGNGGQVFDQTIFLERPVESDPVIVQQPVIRLQGEDIVGQTDGFTTSFINIASEQMSATPEQHAAFINLWMDFLSQQGLYMGNFTIKPDRERASWGGIQDIDIYTLRFNYRGLEIGVANFAFIPQKSRPPLTQSDITFGLERVLWAINKTSRYYDLIGPLTYSLREEDVVMDAYRTTTLMTASGVRPSSEDRGSKLRALAQKYSGLDAEFDPFLVEYYYNWWKQFTSLPEPLPTTLAIMRGEVNRNRNLKIQAAMKASNITVGNVDVRIDSSRYLQETIFNSDDLDKARQSLTGSN